MKSDGLVTRRTVLLGASAGLFQANSAVRLGCQTNSWPIDPKNLSSFGSVLDRVKSFGFHGFETGFRNLQEHFGRPDDVRAVIKRTGLRFFGVHIFLPDGYDAQTSLPPAELYQKVVRGSAPLGAEGLILSGTKADGAGAIQRKCAALNAAARFAKEHRMGCAYHNHGAEFANGAAEIEALYAGTGPAVEFILDAGHARRAGADVPAFVQTHYRRIAGIHLRDLSDRPGDNPNLPPFDLAALAGAIAKVKWAGWLIVEEENAVGRSGDDAVRPAREKLRVQFGF